MNDIDMVMEATNSKKVTLFGFSEGTSLSIIFSAMNPNKVSNLIIFGGFTKTVGDGLESLFKRDDPMVENVEQVIPSTWGKGIWHHNFYQKGQMLLGLC